MRFGTFYFFQAAPGLTHAEVIHRELEQMEWTEELGFDQIWLTEHHFIDYGLAVDPASLAATAAARTRRVRIGLAAAILPFHHPLRLAEQMALIDIISKGRLDVGVGRGNRPAEFRGYHVPQQENRERFDEAVDIILKAWTEERFAHEGRFYTIGDARVIPKPWQRPHPPIYQVCGSDDGIESSAARGWPMLNSLLTGPVDQLTKRRTRYLTALRKHGRTEAEITTLMKDWGVSRQIYVADTDAQALAEAKDAEMWYQDSLRRFQVPERIEDAHPSLQPGFRAAAERFKKVTWEGLVAETVAFGSPDTVTRHIQAMRDMGIGYVLFLRDGYLRSWFRRRSFAADLAISSLTVVALFLVGRGIGQVVTRRDPGRFATSFTEPHLLFFALPYFVVVAVLMVFAMQMNRMIGANVLRYFLAGRYHRPTAEERIFLFLDLERST